MKTFHLIICILLGDCFSLMAQVENVKKVSEIQWLDNDTVCYSNGNPYTGEVIDFSGLKFDRTKLLYDGHFKEGQRNGTIKKWYPNFKIEYIENYTMGLKNGMQVYFYNKGNKKAEYKYFNGLQDGIWSEWYENNQLKYSCNYVMGNVVDGTYNTYAENGQKESETIYEGGKIIKSGKYTNGNYIVLEELSVEKYPDGQKKSAGSLKAGKKNGLWRSWFEGGKLKIEENFVEGSIEGKWISYYENGQIDSTGNYTNNNKEGQWISWYSNGTKKCEGVYKQGKKEGSWHSWFENGSLEFEGNYENDLIEGTATLYYSTKGDVYRGEFRRGLRNGYGKYDYPQSNSSYSYSGYFVNDKFEGSGTLILDYGKTSDTHHGDFKGGKLYNGTVRCNLLGGQITEYKVTNGKWGSMQMINWGDAQHPH